MDTDLKKEKIKETSTKNICSGIFIASGEPTAPAVCVLNACRRHFIL
jgi:hypothetical protein